MAARPSRAYKLKLSKKGIALFIECHGRLCHLVGDLLPYGATLRLAVTLLDRVEPGELAAELASRKLEAFAGKEIRFVGTSPSLAALTAELVTRVARSAGGPAPQTWRLFLAAFTLMRTANDEAVVSTYRFLRESDEAAVSQRSLASS